MDWNAEGKKVDWVRNGHSREEEEDEVALHGSSSHQRQNTVVLVLQLLLLMLLQPPQQLHETEEELSSPLSLHPVPFPVVPDGELPPRHPPPPPVRAPPRIYGRPFQTSYLCLRYIHSIGAFPFHSFTFPHFFFLVLILSLSTFFFFFFAFVVFFWLNCVEEFGMVVKWPSERLPTLAFCIVLTGFYIYIYIYILFHGWKPMIFNVMDEQCSSSFQFQRIQ